MVIVGNQSMSFCRGETRVVFRNAVAADWAGSGHTTNSVARTWPCRVPPPSGAALSGIPPPR